MSDGAVRLVSSFRDPAGYVFEREGRFFRRITAFGAEDWRRFVDSGLAAELVKSRRLVPFREGVEESDGSREIALETLPFISYPYEWSFGQLRGAAVLTLDLMLTALAHGVTLKDASAFNVAFHDGAPIFLDHTSFTVYRAGEPWRAYRQFAMHFLAPLALMRKVDLRCLNFFRSDVGGIPLDFASRLLPWHTFLSPQHLIHIHLHAAMERRCSFAEGKGRSGEVAVPRRRLENLLVSLRDFVAGMRLPGQKTQWEGYYDHNSYSEADLDAKREIVGEVCRCRAPGRVIDLGANTGVFSEIAAHSAGTVIAADIDPKAVEAIYRRSRERCPKLQPVWLDLNNPSPGTGIFAEERSPFMERARGDLVLGLALIHHLRITGNWPLDRIVRLFADLAPGALVEFVPAGDVQTKRLMRGREAIYGDWDLEAVLAAFRQRFRIDRVFPLAGSERVLIEMTRV